MTRVIGLATLGVAAYMAWSAKKAGAGAPAMGERIAPEEARAIIDRLNQTEFSGWFKSAEVLAVIEIESSFRPRAYRAEPQIEDASLGLMQVLGRVAADRGYAGPPDGLFNPETNIRVGMRHLKWTWDYLRRRLGRNPSEDEWIGGYNAGVGNVLRGRWVAGYVEKWRIAKGRYE